MPGVLSTVLQWYLRTLGHATGQSKLTIMPLREAAWVYARSITKSITKNLIPYSEFIEWRGRDMSKNHLREWIVELSKELKGQVMVDDDHH